MTDFAREVTPVTIENELKQSYLDYAMSVIVGRALPDVRDGLKPVHRRVLYAMHELKNDWNKPYKKSARIVGDVIGKYHPHGDGPVYDTIVRMAQSFSLRYMLVDGQGNFGSVDGDAPAAMRYTEIRLTRLAHELMADLDKETVDFVPNYDETEMAPAVLPTRVPNFLINGSSGIAVGMATNVPTHNLGEVIDACLATINNPDINLEELIQIIPGPDFPTAGIINGRSGIIEAYRTGRGRIYLRGRTEIETNDNNGKQAIIVTELPYQVNKARLLEKIGELVKDKKIEGITALRDESDKDGMRMVIELRRGENAQVVLNNLYNHTQLQTVFGINMVALDHGQPKLLNLKQIITAFLDHRREVVTRRSIFELRKARDRAHILEGLGVALVNIDEIVDMIKSSKTPQEAKDKLLANAWPLGTVSAMLEQAGQAASRPEDLGDEFGATADGYKLSAIQAQAILDLRLHRLTGLEQEKIFDEYRDIIKQIQELLLILRDPDHLMRIVSDEMVAIKEQFADQRRTEIIQSQQDITLEDLVADEMVVATISNLGYAKIQPLTDYQAQRRGGRGRSATSVKEEDFVEHLLIANTHDTLLCFTSHGRLYWLKTYLLPQAGRSARGKPLVNLLPLEQDERVNALLPLREYGENDFVVMATRNGVIKKTELKHFANPRNSGIIAIGLDDDDYLIGAQLTTGQQDIMLFSDAGKVIRFNENDVRAMGRTARGVRGMKLAKDQFVVSLVIADQDGVILTATENGYGKRTALDEYRLCKRGGQGVISIQVNQRNGKVIGALQVDDGEQIMLITNGGIVVRTHVAEISLVGRNTQGVRLINLAESESLVGLQRIDDVELDEEEQISEN